MAILVYHPQVPKQLLYGAGPVEGGDGRHLGCQRRYAVGGNLMPEKSDGRLPKLALGDVEGEAALLHDLKDLPEMLEMVAAVGAAHQVLSANGKQNGKSQKFWSMSR